MPTRYVYQLDDETFKKYFADFLKDAQRRGVEIPELAALRERVAELGRLLKKAEWEANDDWDDYCFSCCRYKTSGHAEDCELAAALRGEG